jgi:hypothetical protein
MSVVDNLKNLDRASMTIALPYGRHVGSGHLVMSVNSGTNYIRQALCEGVIDSLEGVWYEGTRIASSDYTLYDGSQTTAPAAPFDQDFAHFGTAMMNVNIGSLGGTDLVNSPPTGLKVIGKFLKLNDYDRTGAVASTAYSANAALVIADLIHVRGGEALSRTNFDRWCDWRDYVGTTESVDYTTIANFAGIGLRGSYYNSTNFTSLVSSRIDPIIYYESSAGAPALGLTATAFSVRWEGKIKAKTTGSYTFAVTHDDSIKIWIGDLTTALIDQPTPGTHSATKSLTADTLYDIKIEWINTAGVSSCQFYWTPPSETQHTVPQEALYPKADAQPRYEANALFEQATDLDTAVRHVLLMSNSIMQMADGQRNFYCIEELTPVMEVDESLIRTGSLKWYRRDRRDLRNNWEVSFRNLESQYLEFADPPVTLDFQELQDACGIKNGQAIDLDNMTYYQAYKVLKNWIAKRETEMDLLCEFDGVASTYPILPGDLITITHSQPGWTSKQFLVLEATDYSAEDTPDRRNFVCIEWT